MMNFLKSILKFFFLALSSLASLMVLAVFMGVFSLLKPKPLPPLPSKGVLSIDLTKELSEVKPFELLRLSGKIPDLSTLELLQVIEAASKDDRIKGLYLKLESTPLSLSQIQDLKEAIDRFKEIAPHKPIVAFSPSFGEMGNGLREYYLASFADKIFCQPMGAVAITGFYVEVPFAQKALEDLGIKAEIEKREGFKSMPDTVLRNEMDPNAKENLTTLLESLNEQVTKQLSQSRKKTIQEIKALMDQAPFTSKQSVENGLVDGVLFEEEVLSTIEDLKGCELIKDSLYSLHQSHHQKPKTTIALISLEGAIESEQERDGSYSINKGGDKTLTKALKDAFEAPEVKGILLRINSGGGSAVASETIGHWVKKSEEHKKPLVISMSDAAASGGYLIAVCGKTILANPATITGSIGVFSGKFNTQEFWKKWGITWDNVSIGKNSSMWAMTRPYSESEKERLNASIDAIYDHFKQLVSVGRNLDIQKISELAKGRVYTGLQAKELGLVDQVGGLLVSLDVLKEQMSLDKKEQLNVWYMPQSLGALEKILSIFDQAALKSLLKKALLEAPLVVKDTLTSFDTAPVIKG